MVHYCPAVPGVVLLLLLSTHPYGRVLTKWTKGNQLHLGLRQLSVLLTMDKINPTNQSHQNKDKDKQVMSKREEVSKLSNKVNLEEVPASPKEDYGDRLKRKIEIIPPPFVQPEASYGGLFHSRHYRDIGRKETVYSGLTHHDSKETEDGSNRLRRSASLMSYIAWRKKHGYGSEVALGRWGRSLFSSKDRKLDISTNDVKHNKAIGPGSYKERSLLGAETRNIEFETTSEDETTHLPQYRVKRSLKRRPKGKFKSYMAWRSENGYGITKIDGDDRSFKLKYE